MTDNEVEEAKTLGQDRGCLLHVSAISDTVSFEVSPDIYCGAFT